MTHPLLDEYRAQSPLLDEYRAEQEPGLVQRAGDWLRGAVEPAKRVLGAEYELGRGAVNTAFGALTLPIQLAKDALTGPTAEEASNPLLVASRVARYGPAAAPGGPLAMQPSGPTMAQQPAGELLRAALPNPIGHIRQAINAPDWFTRGEALGAVPLDLGMIYGATHGLANAAEGMHPSPATVVPTSRPSPKPEVVPETRPYGGQNTIQPLSLLDQYKQSQAAQPEAPAPAPVNSATPTAPVATPSPVVGSITPDMSARIREYVDQALAEPKKFDVPASVTLALRSNDNLGFETRGEAANAVLGHEDWAQRWQVPEPERAALEGWRQATLAQLGAGEGKVVGAIGPTPAAAPIAPTGPVKSTGSLPSASLLGDATRVTSETGDTPARYAVVSADQVLASHQPTMTGEFVPNPLHPGNERGYGRGTAQREGVVANALQWNPDRVLNTDPTPVGGPPMVAPWTRELASEYGVPWERVEGRYFALGGNSRVMSQQLLRGELGRGAQLDAATVERAPAFGLSPTAVRQVPDPMLVRVVEGVKSKADVQRLVRQFNEVPTKALSPEEAAATFGARLSPETIRWMGDTFDPSKTLVANLSNPALTKHLRERLLTDQVVDPASRDRYFTPQGTLTDEGKLFVRNAILGRAVPDRALLATAPESTIDKIERVAPSILRAAEVPGFDIRPSIARILQAQANAGRPLKVAEHMAQASFLPEDQLSGTDLALWHQIESLPSQVLRAKFGTYAAAAERNVVRADPFQNGLGLGDLRKTPPTPDQAFAEAFGPAPEPVGHPSLPINAGRPLGAGAAPTEPAGPPVPPLPRGGIAGAIQTMFAPATRTAAAETAAGIVRYRAAEFARATEMASEALRHYRSVVGHLAPAEQLRLIDDLEHGRSPAAPTLGPVAVGIRGALDAARDDVRGLGTGALEHFNRDYFPHLWRDPAKAEGVLRGLLGRRPLEGPKSFLKHRTIPTVAEGIEAGLIPVTTNPLDLTVLKLREMRRYMMGQRIMADMKADGLVHYVPVFGEGPPGYKPIDDRIAKVYGPPTVPVSESFDPAVRHQLEAVLRAVGGQHTRTVKMPGQMLGVATGPDVRTKFGSDVTVLEHEIGHALDARFGLWDHLTKIPGKDRAAIEARKTMHGELRALADLRFEGQQPGPGYRSYVRKSAEKVANAIHALIYAPERMEAVAPTVKAKLTAFLDGQPETRPLLHLQKSLVAATATANVPVGGLVVKGQFWAPEPVARVLNNYLQPGLRGNALFDAYMGVGNVLNQAQLGLSAFHLGFTSVDAAVSRAALGIEELVAGRPLSAARTLAGVPTAPFTTYLKGSRVLREYLNPGTPSGELGAIVDALVQAGGRVRMDRIYKNNAVEAFQQALRDRQPGRAALQSLPALLELASKPVLEHVVPRQKLGVFSDLARFELSRLPEGATPAQVRAVLGRVWDSVDNRMGQLVYDNLFWSRTLKDLSLASVRSVGWNLGTIRELGGGAADLARGRFTHRAAYVIALPVTVGLLGAITQYLYTGQGPRDLKDYFFPRTGRINEDGNEERVQLPTYVKDVVAYARHPWMTVQHKLQPLLGAVGDMLENQDFYGNLIRNPHDPLVTQLAQEAHYIAGQFIPFGIRNALQQRREGQSIATQGQSFVGITPAPRELVRTPAQNLIHEYLATRGQGGATPEQVEVRTQRRAIEQGVRSGKVGPGALAESLRSGAVTTRQAEGIVRNRAEPPVVGRFRQLTWEEAESVYAEASNRERVALWPILLRKRVGALKELLRAGVNDERVARLRQSVGAAVAR